MTRSASLWARAIGRWAAPLLTVLTGLVLFVRTTAAAEVFTGPYERLPALPPQTPVSTVEADVEADVATMQSTPGADPFWLSAWTETAPFSEDDGLQAPSAVFIRRINAGTAAPGGAPVLLTRTASTARVDTARGTGGAWVVCYAQAEGLKTWWIPADTAVSIPQPVSLWGGGGLTPVFRAAGDGTFLWVWFATPYSSGPDWFLAGRQHLAVLDVQAGQPRLRRIEDSDSLPSYTQFSISSLCASGGRAVLTSTARMAVRNGRLYKNSARVWTNNASYAGTFSSTTGSPGWHGVVPWSNGEFLAVETDSLNTVQNGALIGRRFTASGAAVPGAVPLILSSGRGFGTVLPLQAGGLVSSSNGLLLLDPSRSPVAVSMESRFPMTGLDGTPEFYGVTSSDEGNAVLEIRSGSDAIGPLLPLPTGSGRTSEPVLSWAAESPDQLPLPVLSWRRSFHPTETSPGNERFVAMHQRAVGWQREQLPARDVMAGSGGTWPNDPSRRYLFTFTDEAADITGTYWAGEPGGTGLTAGLKFPVATGLATQTQPLVLIGEYGARSVIWVEETTDSGGDHISKLRQCLVQPGTPPRVGLPFTRYITLRNITRLVADPSGILLWEEGQSIFLASAAGAGVLEPRAASSAGLALLASLWITGSATTLLMNEDNSEPVVFTLRQNQYERQTALVPRMVDQSASVAEDTVFWIGREAGTPAYSLYMQRFENGIPGAVQLLPTGPVVPGQLSATTDTRGRYLVAVRVLQEHEPVLTVFALAAGVPADPGVRIRRASDGELALSWTGSVLYPLDRPLFQRSPDLQNWRFVPASATYRIVDSSFGLEWRVSHRLIPNYFIRLAAELVP